MRVQVVDPGSVQEFFGAGSVSEGPINGGSLEFSSACFAPGRPCARSAHREFTTNETGTYRSKGYLVNMETSSRQGVFCLLC